MKNNSIIKVLAVILCALVVSACTKELVKPLVISTSDYTIFVVDTVSVGDTIGIVPGRSNEGSVAFTILESNLLGAVRIDPTYGEIVVANADLFDFTVNPEITLVVDVAKNNESRTSNVTIVVQENIICFDMDITSFSDFYNAEEDGFDPIEVTYTPGICGIATIRGDFARYACDESPRVGIQFYPSDIDEGEVRIRRQPYSCTEGGNVEISATGTYDRSDNSVEIQYSLYEDGAVVQTGVINFTEAICTSTVSTSIYNGTVSVEDVGSATSSMSSSGSCGRMTIAAADLFGYGCTTVNDIVITLNDDGTAIIENQAWNCDGDPLTIEGSGTFDQGTGVITLAYEIFRNGALEFPGDFVITPFPECSSSVNTDVYDGMVSIEDVGFGGAVDLSTAGGCGKMTIFDADIFGFGCGTVSDIVILLAGDGTATMELQPWTCGFAMQGISGSGTHDTTTGEIKISYVLYDDPEGTAVSFPGDIIITPL